MGFGSDSSGEDVWVEEDALGIRRRINTINRHSVGRCLRDGGERLKFPPPLLLGLIIAVPLTFLGRRRRHRLG
jgi:hypothetical protein